jgi:hypothetical protein
VGGSPETARGTVRRSWLAPGPSSVILRASALMRSGSVGARTARCSAWSAATDNEASDFLVWRRRGECLRRYVAAAAGRRRRDRAGEAEVTRTDIEWMHPTRRAACWQEARRGGAPITGCASAPPVYYIRLTRVQTSPAIDSRRRSPASTSRPAGQQRQAAPADANSLTGQNTGKQDPCGGDEIRTGSSVLMVRLDKNFPTSWPSCHLGCGTPRGS